MRLTLTQINPRKTHPSYSIFNLLILSSLVLLFACAPVNEEGEGLGNHSGSLKTAAPSQEVAEETPENETDENTTSEAADSSIASDGDNELVPQEDVECNTFTVIDMAALPVQLNTGETLLSYSGNGLFSGAIPNSNSCSTIPPGMVRAHSGVGNDGVLVFDTPISEFYLLQLNVQVGDELTIFPSATTTQQTCMPGGFTGNAYHRIVLDSPTTTVHIQDINTGGGSGYSFIVAECADEPVVEDVCCETPAGVQIVSSTDCPLSQQLTMDFCEQDICCETNNGAQILSVTDCPSTQQLPLSACEEEVCCELNGLVFVPASDCPPGHLVPNEECENPEEVCCETANGPAFVPSNQCYGNQILPIQYCDEEVCCNTYNGPVVMFASDCDPNPTLPMSYCESVEDVCCKTDNGAQIIPATDCPQSQLLPLDMCEEPEDVCCETANGLQLLSSDDCPQNQILPMSLCEEEVCCETANGPAFMSVTDCPSSQQLPDSECNPEGCMPEWFQSTSDVEIEDSLVVKITDNAPTTLKADFALSTVLDQLVGLSGAAQPATGDELFQQMWSTQRERTLADDPNLPFCDDNSSTINGHPIDCPRPESVLEQHVADTHEPIALFNRLDLAPLSGSNCGEYRIVYAKKGALGASISGRNFVILEAALPNPDPSCGILACLPVAEFWTSLSDPSLTEQQKADMLRDFYFVGLPGFEPVIHPVNLGMQDPNDPSAPTRGQIRTNQFIDFFDWTLREFRLDQVCDNLGSCRLIARQETVKGNPFPGLFDPTHPDNANFEADFLAGLSSLLPDPDDLSSIGLSVPALYNAGESKEDITNHYAFQPFNPAPINTEVSNLSLSYSVTATEVVRRANGKSCAGCHQTSSNDDLGNGVSWPANNLGFVHVDENSALSDPLQAPGGWLEQRRNIMVTFILDHCDESCDTAVGPAGLDDSGGSILELVPNKTKASDLATSDITKGAPMATSKLKPARARINKNARLKEAVIKARTQGHQQDDDEEEQLPEPTLGGHTVH